MPPEFADDPTLDIEAHVRVVAVPAPGDDRALLDLCGALAELPLDRARPLWEFTLIDGLSDGRSALLQKIHHTITDGVGGLKLSLALVDFERDPEPTVRPDPPDADAAGAEAPGADMPRATPASTTRHAVIDAAHRGIGAVGTTIGTAGHVVIASRPRFRAGPAMPPACSPRCSARRSSPTRPVPTCSTGRSLRRHFETLDLPVRPRCTPPRPSSGAASTTSFVTGFASALGRYHERAGSAVDELRLAMPISTRNRGDRSTNSFVPARVLVPIEPAHDLHTLVRRRARATGSGQAGNRGDRGRRTGRTHLRTPRRRILVAMTRSQTRTIDFAASNLRGSPVPLYLAGARIVGSYPMGPRTGCALDRHDALVLRRGAHRAQHRSRRLRRHRRVHARRARRLRRALHVRL